MAVPHAKKVGKPPSWWLPDVQYAECCSVHMELAICKHVRVRVVELLVRPKPPRSLKSAGCGGGLYSNIIYSGDNIHTPKGGAILVKNMLAERAEANRKKDYMRMPFRSRVDEHTTMVKSLWRCVNAETTSPGVANVAAISNLVKCVKGKSARQPRLKLPRCRRYKNKVSYSQARPNARYDVSAEELQDFSVAAPPAQMVVASQQPRSFSNACGMCCEVPFCTKACLTLV